MKPISLHTPKTRRLLSFMLPSSSILKHKISAKPIIHDTHRASVIAGPITAHLVCILELKRKNEPQGKYLCDGPSSMHIQAHRSTLSSNKEYKKGPAWAENASRSWLTLQDLFKEKKIKKKKIEIVFFSQT